MRCLTEISRPLSWSRLALVAGITFGIAGCSSDMSRLSDNTSASNGGRPSGELAGSLQQKPTTGAINSSTLPPPTGSQPAPLASNQPPITPASPPPVSRVEPNPPVKLVTSSLPPAAGAKKMHVVNSGDTLNKIARQYQVPVSDLTAANNLAPNTKLKLGSQIVVPVAHAPQPAPKVVANLKPVANPPAKTINKITPTPDLSSEKKDITAAAAPSFRWPVRGRVISGFGPTPSGQENHGVNFAVPEGTPVKAAEEGVVAYVGNELKTYGNLVLIRHANGFVTAYAHASEILVKRDEVIKRGQVIAKSGQTGNVSTPQLHFEIRKGSQPVDPMTYLDRGPQA